MKQKEQAAAIVEQANKRANQIVDEAKESALAEGSRLKAAAQAEIEQEMNRAKEQLRGQVATLAVAGAEKILQQSVDAKCTPTAAFWASWATLSEDTMAELSTLARPYAKAAFEFARDSQQLAQWSEVLTAASPVGWATKSCWVVIVAITNVKPNGSSV